MTRAESETSADLQAWVRFETLLVEISACFVHLPTDQIDREIQDAQRRICECLGLDRSTLWQITDPERGSLRLTHIHQALGDSPVRAHADENLASSGDRIPQCPQWPMPHLRFDAKELPWLLEQVKRGEPILISRIDDLPAEAEHDKELFRRFGTKSTAIIPLVVGREFLGVVTFVTMREERAWPETVVKRLRLIAQTFANAVARMRLARALGESEERMSLAEASADLSLWVWDVPGDFIWASDRARALLGVPVEEVLRFSRFLACLHPDDRKNVQEEMQKAIREKADFRWEFRVLHPDGSARWIAASGSCRLDSLGQPDRMIGVSLDITALKKSQSSLREALSEIERLKDQLQKENLFLRQEAALQHGAGTIVGQSAAILGVLRQIEQVAPTEATVLIQGETGSGKERIAGRIHELSSHRDRAMVTVNCAALPATLIESELFGRERGAYTGALTRQIGRFEVADNSTIFLDEIADLPLELQAKLLRVIEQGEFERLGGNKTLHVKVRVIAATNRDLGKAVREGRFREDLFYRLNVFPISVPPLRARLEDIPLLVWSFVSQIGQGMGRIIERIPKEDMDALQGYSWPGNVRELRNLVERAVILATDATLRIRPPLIVNGATGSARTLDEVQREHILHILTRTGWRVSGAKGAAAILGINAKTLESRMAKLRIRRPESPEIQGRS
jgi:formate hydrogenlyase transcriptional activator